ncbi:MAG: chemotaxis protein CheA [Gemmatimonadaceae bacterium]|nr:chemotaxis protein CheA [Gemmatimonadaceae bacterium]
MDDLLRDFLTESGENLGKLDNDIVELERNPGDVARLNSVFRTIHTIKGTCGFLGLARLEGVAHAAENVLDSLRAGRLQVQADLIGDILAAIDTIKFVLLRLEQTETEPEGDDAPLIARLETWLALDGRSAPAPDAAPFAAMPNLPVLPNIPTQVASGIPLAAAASVAPVLVPSTSARADALAAPEASAFVAHDGAEHRDNRRDGLDRRGQADLVSDGRPGLSESTLRVGVDVLDKLMNLVGELALGRNQLLQLTTSQEESPFAKPVQQLDRVTTDLLEAVMKTRMQPIGNAWTKLPRLVRDLSQSSGKQIVLSMHGAETDLDRQILQAIQDPLTHMVRNSADHGIETAVARRAAGKPEQGTIRLSAHHEGGHVVIEIADDGAGINASRVRRKAIERGLVKADVAEAMPDAQILRYIFEPGFSTAEQVTNVSGRGVGMDVVRSNIDAIGGTVELSSQHGRGTTVRIKIPLTLAIISALLVGTAGESFAVPQIGIVELVGVTEEQRGLVEHVHGAQFYRLRDTLLPLVHLRTLLRLEPCDVQVSYNIVVCQVGEARFGLVVEHVFDTQEIVVKPVGRLIKHLQAYAGCTITGDGRVIMILDTGGIATLANVASNETRDEVERAAHQAAQARAAAQADAKESVLLFDAGYPALQAVPLSLVARLEEFALSSLEEADGRFLVQYRGALMPVVAANPDMDLRAMDPRPVIVFSDRNRTLGVAVNEIRDIVEDSLHLQRRAARPGVLGIAVIAGRATEVIDTDHFLRQANGELPGHAAANISDDPGRHPAASLAPVAAA